MTTIKRIGLVIAAAFIFSALTVYIARPATPPQEGAAAACDNSHAKDTAGRNHHCECERAAQDHCDAEGVQHPGSACKTYCKPDSCDCAGPCVPS